MGDHLFTFLFGQHYHWSLMGLYGLFLWGRWSVRWQDYRKRSRERRTMKAVGLAKRPSHPFSQDPPS